MSHLYNGDLTLAVDYLDQASDHGLKPPNVPGR